MKAILYIDETGKFQPEADDSRVVGGLLVDSSLKKQLANIHKAAKSSVSWPCRLHAAEFGQERFLRAWYAALVSKGQKLPGCVSEKTTHALTNCQAILVQGAPDVSGWLRAVKHWNTPSIPEAAKRVLSQLGASLRRETRERIRDGIKEACLAKPVHFIAGHVHDRAISAEGAYRACTLSVVRLVAALGFTEAEIHVAKPSLGTTATEREIWETASVRAGLKVTVEGHDYDNGPEGLWLADSLLHWAFQDSGVPFLSSMDHGVWEECIYTLSTLPMPAKIGSEDYLLKVCQRTKKLDKLQVSEGQEP